MGEKEISPEDIHFWEKQRIILERLPVAGRILDIGGGGEGVIGRLMGEQVIAIDPSRRELREAPHGPLKIVMDARDLQFVARSFGTVTSFFTLMYVPPADHRQIFAEVRRVLQPGGEFWVWDGMLPTRGENPKKLAAFLLHIILPDDEIETGYGTQWPQVPLNAAYYSRLALDVGFELVAEERDGRFFKLRFRKTTIPAFEMG